MKPIYDGMDDDDTPPTPATTEPAWTGPAADLIARHAKLPANVLSVKPPPRDWLAAQQLTNDNGDDQKEVRGVLCRGSLHILAGEGGAGKGRWVTTMAAAIATAPTSGREVCGLHVSPLHDDERILLLLGEDNGLDVYERFHAAGEALGLRPSDERRLVDRIDYFSAHGLPFLVASGREGEVESTPAWLDFVEWAKEKGPWGLIVVDTLARFGGVPENDNQAQTRMLTMIESLTSANSNFPNAKEPVVIAVDHTVKPSAENRGASKKPRALTQHDVRGAGAKVNSARVVLAMNPHDEWVCVDEDGNETGIGNLHAMARDELSVFSVVKNNSARKAETIFLLNDGGGMVELTDDMQREVRKRFYTAARRKGKLYKGDKLASDEDKNTTSSNPAKGNSKRGRGAEGAGSNMTTTPSQAPIVGNATNNPWEGSNV